MEAKNAFGYFSKTKTSLVLIQNGFVKSNTALKSHTEYAVWEGHYVAF